MTATSRRIVLAARPTGMVDETTTRLEHVEVPHPAPGQALVWVRYLSIDPTIRTWMDDAPGYLPPIEVEKVLYTHPAVLDAAFVGIPDEKWGEAVLAVVAFKPGRSATPEELLQLCRSSSLSSIKQPERVEIVDSMPRNTIGKIDKKAVRERYWVGRRKV